MRFKITNINNVENFSKALDRCKGNVELISSEGDKLNLKSKLTQLISLNVLLSGISQLKDIELSIEDPEDARILMEYVAGERS